MRPVHRWLAALLLLSVPARAENDLEDLERLLEDPEARAAFEAIGQAPAAAAGPGADPCDDPEAPAERRVSCALADGKIEHVLFVVLENHTFDNYFGRLNLDRVRVPGADVSTPENFIPQRTTGPESPGRTAADYTRFPTGETFHLTQYCGWADLGHEWKEIHEQVAGGKLDGYLVANPTDAPALGQFQQSDLAFYYELAERFAIADRAFSSAATQSLPNHYFSLSGTSRGFVANSFQTPRPGAVDPGSGAIEPVKLTNDWPTIFDSLSTHGVSWKIYMPHVAVPMLFDQWRRWAREGHMTHSAQFYADLAAGTLPQVSYVSPAIAYTDEHPGLSANHQRGQLHFSTVVSALLRSPVWEKSLLVITYDDSGGWYDHVPPPRTYQPNDGCTDPARCVNGTYLPGTNAGAAAPLPESARFGDEFDLLGARLPMMIVSPWLKGPRTDAPGYDPALPQGYVTHHVYENATILSFLEWRFGIPSLNDRTRAYRDGWRNPGCDWDTGALAAAATAPDASAEVKALAWSAALPDPFRTVRCEPCDARSDPFCPLPDPDAGLDGRARVRNLATPDPDDTIPMTLAVAENRRLDPLLDVFDFGKTSLPDGAAIAAALDPLAGTDLVEWVSCPGPNPLRVPPGS